MTSFTRFINRFNLDLVGNFIKFFEILFCLGLVISVLVGCSRQSVADFTPYPSLQSNLKVIFDFDTPYTFKNIDNSLVEISNIKMFVNKVKVSSSVTKKNKVMIRSLIRTHENHNASHEQEENEHHRHYDDSDQSSHSLPVDQNILQPDSRQFLPLEFVVHKLFSGGKTDITGIAATVGSTLLLNVNLIPSYDNKNLTVFVAGTVKFPGKVASSTFSIKINHEIEFNIPYSIEKQIHDVEISFKPEKWFENIYLSQLFGSENSFTIDEGNELLVHKFIENFVNSVYVK